MQGKRKFKLAQKVEIASMKDLLRSINEIKDKEGLTQLWYRGHSNAAEYKLVPSIARKYKYGGKSVDGFCLKQERNLLHRFRRRAYPYVGGILGEWEALFLARHHGLPTRMLDWAVSPLVALYFACSSTKNLDKPAKVWGIARIPDESYDLDMLKFTTLNDDQHGPFKLYEELGEPKDEKHTEDAVKILHPFYNSPRIIAQGGVFTFHSNPKILLDSYQDKLFRCERLDIECLIPWDIGPNEVKKGILRELENVGINRRAVCPDLDGLAQGLWETEVLWNGDPDKTDDGKT